MVRKTLILLASSPLHPLVELTILLSMKSGGYSTKTRSWQRFQPVTPQALNVFPAIGTDRGSINQSPPSWASRYDLEDATSTSATRLPFLASAAATDSTTTSSVDPMDRQLERDKRLSKQVLVWFFFPRRNRMVVVLLALSFSPRHVSFAESANIELNICRYLDFGPET